MNINIENFRSGHSLSGYGHQYFMPNHINTGWAWSNPQINQLLERAALRLGELNSFARLIPNVDLFVQLHVSREAVEREPKHHFYALLHAGGVAIVVRIAVTKRIMQNKTHSALMDLRS